MGNGTRRVLLVEDHTDIQRIEAILASACDYDVVEVDNAEAALAALEANGIDVVILDLGLPGMSGWSVAEHAARAGHPAVVICSAHAKVPGVAERAREYGVVDVLDKTELTTRLPGVLMELAAAA